MGSRKEGNTNALEWVMSLSETTATFKEGVILNLNVIATLLADISRSLAVIADAMQQDEEKEE